MKTNKSEYDVAIIGAGPNGLICAGYLARAGLSVILLEARHETGGGLDTLEFAGFRHNPHAIYHMMADLMPPYHDFELPKRGVRFIWPDVQAAYISKNTPPLVFYKDPEKTAQFISAHFSEKDAEGFRKLYKDFAEYSEKILIPLTYVPAMPPVEQVQILMNAKDDVGKRFNEVAELTPLEMLEDYDLSDPVKAGILNLYSMWGLSPHEALGYIFPLYVYRMTNAAIVSGGSHRLSSAFHKVVVEAGGEICDAAPVAKVTTEGGKVSGVVLKDGTEIRAKVVASTVDPVQNFLEFFDDGVVPAGLQENARKWEWEKATLFGAHISLREAPKYIGSDQVPDLNQALVTHLGVESTEQIINHVQDVEDGKLTDPFGHATCTSLFDPIQAPPGYVSGRWECLVPYEADWDNIRDEYAEKSMKAWKEYAPNLDPMNVWAYPPNYIELKFKNMVKGSIKQGAYVPLQMGYLRPNEQCSQVWTPVENFFVCGASVYPGGMIIGGPGYVGANVICEEMEVKKTWDEPEMVKQAAERGLV